MYISVNDLEFLKEIKKNVRGANRERLENIIEKAESRRAESNEKTRLIVAERRKTNKNYAR